MRFMFLGTGSAFTTGQGNWQSNIAIQRGVQVLLFDCGGDIRHSLREQDIKLTQIDAVYVSHEHTDHYGGLEYVGFGTYFGGTQLPILFAERGLMEFLRVVLEPMNTIHGSQATFDNFFDARPFDACATFRWQDLTMTHVDTVHVQGSQREMHSGGLYITGAGQKVYITGDTRNRPNELMPWYVDADVIFQDAELGFATQVHANYKDLCDLPQVIKSKMHLYHYGDVRPLPDAVGNGFAGWVQKGQVFDFGDAE